MKIAVLFNGAGLDEGLGNGVPVYMARGFGEAYSG